MGYTWRYYDLVLLGVFVSMGFGTVVGLLTTVSMSMAVTLAGLAAVAVIAHGLFVNGPVEEPGDLGDEVEALN